MSTESFREAYEKTVLEGMSKLHEKLFPKELMREFEELAAEHVRLGRNRCSGNGYACQKETMQFVYPYGVWVCPEHAQREWTRDTLRGAVVFDMTPEPARTPDEPVA